MVATDVRFATLALMISNGAETRRFSNIANGAARAVEHLSAYELGEQDSVDSGYETFSTDC